MLSFTDTVGVNGEVEERGGYGKVGCPLRESGTEEQNRVRRRRHTGRVGRLHRNDHSSTVYAVALTGREF